MCDNVYTNSILCSHNLDILNIPNAFSNLTNPTIPIEQKSVSDYLYICFIKSYITTLLDY